MWGSKGWKGQCAWKFDVDLFEKKDGGGAEVN
jgi:hypothetical protein